MQKYDYDYNPYVLEADFPAVLQDRVGKGYRLHTFERNVDGSLLVIFERDIADKKSEEMIAKLNG